MDPEIIKILINAGLAIAAIVFGAKYKAGKAEAKEAVNLAGMKTNQAIDFANTIMDAVEDDNVSPEEEKVIINKWKFMLPKKEI